MPESIDQLRAWQQEENALDEALSWWRFDRYELVPEPNDAPRDALIRPTPGDFVVRPAPGATAESYRPWDGYDPNRGTSPPYLSFLRLLDHLPVPSPFGPYTVEGDAAAAVLNWCQSYGLPGVGLQTNLPTYADGNTHSEPVRYIQWAAFGLRRSIAAVNGARSPFERLRSMADLLFQARLPSLHGAFAGMALLDLMERQLLTCQVCKGWFTAWRAEARYCSEKCKWQGQKKRQRARGREDSDGKA